MTRDDEDRRAPGSAAHLPRRRARRRQDLRHARRGPAPARARHRRGGRASSRPTAAPTPPRRSRDLEVMPRARDRAPRARRSRRWTSTPSSPGAPEVALVDELAHTNVPGSRHAKRWQDVEELLDAGHRRHLDGQHPAPGVAQRRRRGDHRRRQRETVPDAVVRARRPDRAGRHDARRRCAGAWPTATSTPPRRSTPPSANYFRLGQPGRPARAGAAVGGRPGRRGARSDYRDAHGHRPSRGRPASGSSSPSPAAPSGETLIRRGRPHRRARRRRRAGRRPRRAAPTGCAAPTRTLLDRAAALLEELGGATTRSPATTWPTPSSTSPAAVNATQLVHGRAAARSGLARAARRLGVGERSIRPRPATIDVHVVSPRRSRAGRLPSGAAPAPRSAAGAGSPAGSSPWSAVRCPHRAAAAAHGDGSSCPRACCSSCCSWSRRRSSAGCGRRWSPRSSRPAGSTGSSPPARARSHRRARERCRPAWCSSPWPRSSAWLVDQAARRSAEQAAPGRGARPQRPGRARRPSCAARHDRCPALLDRSCATSHARRPSLVRRRRERLDGRGRRPGPVAAATRRRAAGRADRRRRGRPGARRRRPLGGRPARCSPRSPPSSPPRSSTARSAEEAARRRRARRGQPLAHRPAGAVSHDLRTPLADIKAAVTSLLSADVEWSPRTTARAARDDRGGGRPARRPGRQPARHDAASRPACSAVAPASGAARRGRARRARRRCPTGAGRGRTRSPTTCPPSGRPGLLERALANLIANAAAPRPGRHAVRVVRPAGSATRSSCAWSTGARRPTGQPRAIFEPFQRLGDAPRRRRRASASGSPSPGLRRGHGRHADGRGHPRRRPDHGHRPARGAPASPSAGPPMTASWSSTTSPASARTLAINLRARGYDVDLAATGEEALQRWPRATPTW